MKTITFSKIDSTFCLLLVLAFLLPFSMHATEIKNINLSAQVRLFPDHVGGDRDFGGNGPNVNTNVRLKISRDKRKLEAVIYFQAKETKSDWTEGKKTWTRSVANAPAGYEFVRILSSTYSSARYTDRNYQMDYPSVQGGNLVRRFVVKGDTGGSDVGNTTSDDTHLTVYFNTARVEIKKIGGGKRTIPQSTWIRQLQRAFDKTDIRLNNYTPRRFQYNRTEEFAYHKPNDSYIKTIYNGREYKYNINVPVERRNPVSIYIKDMNTYRVSASRYSNQLKMSLYFESNGKEMWSNCVANGGCFAIGNREVDMNTAKVDLYLKPKVVRGKLTYDCTRVVLNSTAKIDGCHDDFFAFLCDLFMPNRQSMIKTKVQTALMGQLNNNVHKSIISEVLRQNLGLSGTIKDAYIDTRTGNLVITQ